MIILPIISAILLNFAYPTFNLWFLAWIALIPLFFALENKNTKQRFIIGYFFGIVFFSGILYWLTNVSVPGAFILIALLSLAPAIFTSLYQGRKYSSASFGAGVIRDMIFVPSAWVFTEYLRAHLLTGFPWALLGYSQSPNLPVIQIADMTGAYGVSFLIILVNFSIYLMLKKTAKRFYILFSIFLLFSIVLTYGQYAMRRAYPIQSLKVSVIQGNIPQEIKWDSRYKNFIIDKQKAITEESLKENPRLVIWPETSVSGYLEEADLKKQITALAESANVFLLVGTLNAENSNIFNSATLISNKGKILQTYDKIHLVPFGEFIPFGKTFSWVRSFVNKPIADFDRGKDFTVFKFKLRNEIHKPDKVQKTIEFHSFSTLICFEDIFPELARNFVKKGARFLVNITNDVWFGKTSAPYQHAQGSIFRAVENRVPVVRAANTGLSCIIDHKGKIISAVGGSTKGEIFVDGYAVGTIRPTFSKTIYTRFGDVFSWICIVLVFLGVASRKIAKMKTIAILVMVFISTFVVCSEAEVHYRGKFKFPFSFGKKYNYSNILVTRVIDGDTLELENKERVRLIGIDTPETWFGPKLEQDSKRTGRDYKTIMAMGKKATNFTKSLVEGKRVRLEFDVEKKDRYERSLAYVYLPNGRMLNAELVRNGYAQVYTFQPNVKYVDLFLKLQREARENNRGLWSE